jgi:ribosomal protein S18 acetylase RimI-like enzyme
MDDSRQLTLSDAEEAAKVIAQAFVEDPLTSFMLPIKATRVKTLLKFFRVYAEINIKAGRGFGVGEPLQGVAFWKFPSQESMSISVKSLGKLLPLLFTMYPIGYFRARKIIDQIDALHAKHALEPHFYLDNLGVLAAARGQGLSSKLIRPFMQKADEQKVVAYTDTVTKTNVPLYEHFGFQCVEESFIKETGITVYAMKRTAQ